MGICKLELSHCGSFSVVCRILYLEQLHRLRYHQLRVPSENNVTFDVALGQSEGRLGGHPSGHVRYSGPVRRSKSLAEVLTVPGVSGGGEPGEPREIGELGEQGEPGEP